MFESSVFEKDPAIDLWKNMCNSWVDLLKACGRTKFQNTRAIMR